MTDDLFGSPQPDEGEDDFEALRSELAVTLAEFADDQDIDEDVLSLLLLDAAISQRALAYVLVTEKSSEGGLKLEIDRFGRAFGEMLREAKKGAGPMLARLREVVAAIEKDIAAEEPEAD